ncbi:MAG: HAMP domain-containing protein [Rhodoferax sp.]
MVLNKLYLRIWLAVVATVALLTLLVGVVWRMSVEPPLREVVVRDAQGRIIGSGVARLHPGAPPQRLHGERSAGGEAPGAAPRRGPEFEVRMHDGQTLHLHLPRPPRSGGAWWAPFGFAWTLALVALAVALATYPIVRRLTRNLEQLQQGVRRLGEGDLTVRVPVCGGDEVASLAEGFNQSAQRIQALVGSRDALLASQKSLLANASHELRSPLARIRIGLELLDHGGEPTAQRLHDELARNIAELDALVDELLLLGRLDAGQRDLGTVESVDLLAVAREECARAQLALDGMDAAPRVLVQGVAQLLRRLVRKLVAYAQRNPACGMRLQWQVLAQGEAALTLWDPHSPLTVEQAQRLFEPFYRPAGASERDGGVGLGLALVKAIAEYHGARVQCLRDPHGGLGLQVRFAGAGAEEKPPNTTM